MSAKQRSRIARQELVDAQADPVFLNQMVLADSLARARRFDDALVAYGEARRMRPYNVSPKVRIQDLEDLIAREEAKAKETNVPEVVPIMEPTVHELPPTDPGTTQRLPEPVTKGPEKVTRTEKPRQVPTRREVPVAAPKEMAPVPQADGVNERSYKDGRAIVIERTVHANGRSTVYKRVVHPWGEVFYFKDGETVSERVWKETLEASH